MSNLVIEPVAINPGQEIWHVTTRSTCDEIIKRGGLVPLNWILEGTNGQSKSSNVTGLDAARGFGDYTSPEQHEAELKKTHDDCVKATKDLPDQDLARMIWKRYASVKLGRKRDFVYGTKSRAAVWKYTGVYEEKKVAQMKDLFLLRWKAAGEVYYKDEEDDLALKTLSSIPLNRLDVASLADLKDETLDEFAKLKYEPLGSTKMI